MEAQVIDFVNELASSPGNEGVDAIWYSVAVSASRHQEFRTKH